MRTWFGLTGVGLLVGATLSGSPVEAQVGGPPAGVRTCTDVSSQQPRAAILSWANSLRVRDTTHAGGGHQANLTFDNPRRIGPAAAVWPVDGVNRMPALNRDENGQGRVGTLVARVWVDPSFQDAANNNARGYAPLDMPPGYSWIMMCEETSGGTTTYTALIIPEDASEPLRSRAVRYFDISDQLPTARARFQKANSEKLCVSCKVRGWCEM